MQVSPLDHGHASGNVVTIPNRIHPTAIIAPGAKIGTDVSIGPYSIIGEHVSIGNGTTIGSHVNIEGWTQVGARNQIFSGAVIGSIPQDLKFKGEKSSLCIGNDNIIREYVTINRGTAGGGGNTSIGNSNVILTYAHVAHDVQIGNNVIISNSVAIAGHVIIEDWVTIGGLTGIHQFVRLGYMSMLGANSKISQDVLPFGLINGNPPKHCGINIERLRRNNYTAEARLIIQRAYKIIFQEGLSIAQALEQLTQKFPGNADVECMIQFLHASTRGISR